MTNAQEYSRKYLKKKGYHIDTVERWFTFPKRENGKPVTRNGIPVVVRSRKDCFGSFDLVAVHPEKTGTLYVQTTTTSHQADRIAKVMSSETTPAILKASNRIHVHGVRQCRRGGRSVMKLTVTEFYLAKDGFVETQVIDDVDDDPSLFTD